MLKYIKSAFHNTALWLALHLGAKSSTRRTSPGTSVAELDAHIQMERDFEAKMNLIWQNSQEYATLMTMDNTLENLKRKEKGLPPISDAEVKKLTRGRAVPEKDKNKKMIEYWENRAAQDNEKYI
jgi:hypothetical protein